MLKFIKHICVVALMLSIGSCHKNQITLLTRSVQSNTTYDLNCIEFINDSVGYICGGARYSIGVVIKTTDGGKTWSAPDSAIPKALYAMSIFSANELMLGGFDGMLAYTIDNAHTFSTTQLSLGIPVNHLSFSSRQHGLASCGIAYGNGAVYNTTNGGSTWALAYRDTLHSCQGVACLDDTTVVICGYGTVLRSQNGGATFSVVRENGDFYQDVHFVNRNTGYAVGYQGEIIKSTDAGQSWQIVRAGNGVFSSPSNFWSLDFIDENNGYAVGESGLMVHTSNGGQDWQTVKPFTGERLRAVRMFSATSGIVAGSGGRVYLFQQ